MLGFGERNQTTARRDAGVPEVDRIASLLACHETVGAYLHELAQGKLDTDFTPLESLARTADIKPAFRAILRSLGEVMRARAMSNLDNAVDLCMNNSEAAIGGARLMAASQNQSDRCQGLAAASQRWSPR
jgi:methyl-accepting chemotaxis protein